MHNAHSKLLFHCTLHYWHSPLSSLVIIPPPLPLAHHFSQHYLRACKACVTRGGFWQGCRHQSDQKNKFKEFLPSPAQWCKERLRQQRNNQSGWMIRGSGETTGRGAIRQEAGIVAHKLNRKKWSICKRVLLDVLSFVKITLGEQTQHSTNSWRQQWNLLWRGCTAGAEWMGRCYLFVQGWKLNDETRKREEIMNWP